MGESTLFNVLDYGAKGDGVTPDHIAIQSAITAAGLAGGGMVCFPPTGNPYLIAVGLTVPSGVTLMGAGTRSFPRIVGNSFVSTHSNMASVDWCYSGSWVTSIDTTTPAVTLTGDGASVVGLNFFFAQPMPSGLNFTPTIYPWCIATAQASLAGLQIRNVMIIGATNGIILHFGAGVGGGSGCIIDSVYLIALLVGLQIVSANDTVYVSNLTVVNIFMPPQVSAYQSFRLIGIRVVHAENLVMSNIQIYSASEGMRIENGTTTLGGTTGVIHGLMSNVQFNLCASGIVLAAEDTQFICQISNLYAQNDPMLALASGSAVTIHGPDVLLRLASNEVDVTISGCDLFCNKAVHAVALGAGGPSRTTFLSGPSLLITNFRGYSTGSGSAALFNVAAHAAASLSSWALSDRDPARLKSGSGSLFVNTFTPWP